MLISFIIPSYNSAQTVARCLNSIYALSLRQTDFEVIFIDDCSTDNTCEIVAAYQSKHANITLLKQSKNSRQGAARNRGVKIAKGEYICFVDSDDAVTEGVVDAIRMSKEKQTDMTILHFANANENGEITSEAEKLSFSEEQVFTGIAMQNTYPYWCSAPWGYVYGREFLNRVNYPFAEDVLFEDSDFVATYLYYAKRMAYSIALGYIAYYREGSTTRSTCYKNVADYLLLGTRMMALYEWIKSERLTSERVNELESEDFEKFAEGILEGACWNVEKSCKRIIKLENVKEIKEYYNRIDAHVNRLDLCSDSRFHKYYWNAWTDICIRHKEITIFLLAFVMPIYKCLRRIVK